MPIQDELARRYLGRRVVDNKGVVGRITEIDHESALLKVEFLPNQAIGHTVFRHCWYDLWAFQGEHKFFTIIKPRMKPVNSDRWLCLYDWEYSSFAFHTMEEAYLHCCMANGDYIPKELAAKYLRVTV